MTDPRRPAGTLAEHDRLGTIAPTSLSGSTPCLGVAELDVL